MKIRTLIGFLLLATSMMAANTVTTQSSRITTNVNVAANTDYVLTLSSNIFSNSGGLNIPANSMEHSVIIFKAVKPSVVLANWLKYVRINGVNAADGQNCQVRMYNKGTIILPYASDFHPLTCYSGTGYSGTACSNYTTGSDGGYMKTLGNEQLPNNIRSFKLKRGYMVTFATGTAGYGYSRCFIADTEDLEMNLPPVLAGKVSSYRLFQWLNFGKTGIANNTDAATCNALNVQGCYTYNVGGNMNPDVEWLPHKIHKNWPGIAECGNTEYACTMKTDNEPANSSDDTPASVSDVLAYWENAMRTGLRLCSPSTYDGSPNATWFKDFFAAIDSRGWRCDIYDIHCYWASFSNLSDYYNAYKRPLLISEWMWGASWNSNGAFGSGVTDSQIQTNTSNILTTLNNAAYVERYFYWNSESKAHIYENGALTELGKIYASTDGGLGYNKSYEYVPKVVIHKPYDLKWAVSGDNIEMSWKDKNGDNVDDICIQYKLPNASSWTTIATISPKDKISSSAQNYSFSGTLQDAGEYWWRIVNQFDGSDTASDVLMLQGQQIDNSNVLPANLSDFYFQFYSKEANADLVWAVYDSSSSENKVYYKAHNSHYGEDLYQLWTLETNSNGGYSLRNAGEPNYLICSPNSWNFTTRNDEYTSEGTKTAFDLTYMSDGDYWIMKNLAHGTYVGLWDTDKSFAAGEVLAGNRTNPTDGKDSADKLGIRLIPKSVVNEVLGIITIPSGSYYLYNEATGFFVAAGNGWDTQSVAAETGLDFGLISSANGYQLESNISNGGTSHYLGSNLFCDSAPFSWTFSEAGSSNDHTLYTIANGSNYITAPSSANTALTTSSTPNSANSLWQLLTRGDLMERMANATEEQPVDATFLLPGHRFGRNDGRIANWNGGPTRGGYAGSDWGDHNGEKFNTTFDVYLEIENAPDGIYEVSMQGFYRDGGYDAAATLRSGGNEALNALLYGNDASMELPSIFSEAGNCGTQGVNQSTYGYIPNSQSDASYYIHEGLYQTGPLRFTVEGGTLRVGVRKTVAVVNDWTVFDNFKLMYLGPSSILGDVNKDRSITIADVTALVDIILGKDNTMPYQYDHQAADVNKDGGITIADVTALVDVILGK